jgi:TRAP-type uncharacterized transport system substrate-binding protein
MKHTLKTHTTPLHPIRRRAGAVIASFVTACTLSIGSPAQAETIVTGGKTGTYFAIGNNLRDLLDKRLEVKDTNGSWANVEEMSRTKGVTLAIVQSDVYAAFVQMRDDKSVPESTRKEYAQVLANLRVFMPLYPEEVHFLVRKDDPMEYVHQIKDKAIWMDVEKSGTFLTALNVYGKLFQTRPNRVQPFVNPTATGEDEGTRRRRSALMALSDPAFYAAYPRVDVMVVVGGQPLALLEKNAPANLKLLKFDPKNPSSAAILREYQTADIKKTSYPLLNIEGASSPTLAVNSYLITANFADAQRNQFVENFATQFCNQWDALQSQGHPKWKALTWKPGEPLPALATGWQYSERARARLSQCRTETRRATNTEPAPSACSPQDRFSGLCR